MEIEKKVVLLNATKTIIDKGWTKGAYFRDASQQYTRDPNEICSACLVGACGLATGHLRSFMRHQDSAALVTELAITLRKTGVTVIPNKYDDEAIVTVWNDTPGRTKDEVLGLIDKTIKRLNADREDVA